MTRTPSQVRPSIKSGYARSAAESAFPGLWRGLDIAHVPELGLTGSTLPNYAGRYDLNFEGTGSVADQNFYRGAYCHLWNTDGDGITINSHPARNYSGMTVMIFYSPLDLTTGGAKWLFSKMTADEADVQWMLNHTSNVEKVRFYYTVPGGSRSITSSVNTVSGGDWQHVAATLGSSDGTNYQGKVLYLNGEIVGSAPTPTQGYDEAGKVWIGERFSGSLSAESYIKSAFYWTRELSHEEVRQFHADPLAPFRLRRQVSFAAPTEAAAAYHIYLSMSETGRFGINNGQLGVRES